MPKISELPAFSSAADADLGPIVEDTTGTPTTRRRTMAQLRTALYGISEVTGTSGSLTNNKTFIANNAALVTLTLPTTASVGDIIEVVGKGAGGWRIAQNASQQIHRGSSSTTSGVGGRLDSTNRRDCIRLICTVADTEWTAQSLNGTITVT